MIEKPENLTSDTSARMLEQSTVHTGAIQGGSAIVAGMVEPIPVNIPQDVDITSQAVAEQSSELSPQAKEMLESTYSNFLSAEQREALPNDPVMVGIKPDSIEYETLKSSGISEEKIRQGNFTRAELLAAGYRFINTLGGGEKGIISGVMQNPETGEGVDFTGRTLLDKAELDMVYQYQQSHPEMYGLQGEDIEEVRKDMLSFLFEATAESPFGSNADFVVQIFSSLRHQYEYGMLDKADWEAVNAYVETQAKEYKQTHQDVTDYEALNAVQKEIVRTHSGDLYEWQDEEVKSSAFNAKQVRGIHTSSLMMARADSLRGQPSPFLESGFYFGVNLDVNVFTGQSADMRSREQLRMNIATLHLAGGHPDYPGFSEMGGVSADQQYMPTGYYVNTIYPKDAEERLKVQSAETATIAARSRQATIDTAGQRLIEIAKANSAHSQHKRWFRRK